MTPELKPWSPMTWGEVLDQFAHVPLETPVYEVKIRHHMGELTMTDIDPHEAPGGIKLWRKRVKEFMDKNKRAEGEG